MKFLKEISFSLIIQAISLLVTVINKFAFAKVLDSNGFGLYNLLIILPLLLSLLFNLGLGHSISYHISKKIVNNNFAYYFVITYTVSISPLIICLSFFILNLIYSDLPNILLFFSLLTVPFLLLNYFLSFIFLGNDKSSYYFIFNNLPVIITTVFLLVLLFILDDVNLIISINLYFLGQFLTSIIMIITVHNKLLKSSESYYKGFLVCLKNDLVKDIFSFGIKMYFASIMNFLNYRLDTLLIGKLLPLKLLGNYNLAVNFADSFGKISQTISLLVYSKLPRLAENDKKVMVNLIIKLNLILLVIGSLVMFLIGDKIIYLIGTDYSYAYIAFLLLVPGMFFIALFRIIYHVVSVEYNANWGMYATFFSLISTIALDLILIPVYGIYGASVASSLSYSVSFLFIYIYYIKQTNSNFFSIFLISKREKDTIKRLALNLIKRGQNTCSR
ncbi:oligosaccharide flippase family protein [Parageobacillus sp. VR-IP]|uniref:oligosaccharide flippase family protein n=1 Tax=Parageobacillus sp. VR-IP TaxID=2742205 RepID=UPI00158374F0|nr:oligosaccharide flippase family protein [Parageobacillus sp. VR-IP]NUK29895.1 oligosaccharide flippase family protein [Parageobacillus sp. VR-IP]